MLRLAFVRFFLTGRQWRPATRAEALDMLARIKAGKNNEQWMTELTVREMPGPVGFFLISVPESWDAALEDPEDGQVIAQLGQVQLEMHQAMQMNIH